MKNTKNNNDTMHKTLNHFKNLIGKKVLRLYNEEVPQGCYISKSRLMWDVFTHDLSEVECRGVEKKLSFFNRHQEDYKIVRENPTRENIKAKRVANCGELADSALDLFPENIPLMRAKITIEIPRTRLTEKGITFSDSETGKETVSLQHVFLMYHDKTNDVPLNVLNPHHPHSFAVDIWRGETKQSAELIMQHLREAGVSEATMIITFPRDKRDRLYYYHIKSDGTIKLLNPPIDDRPARASEKDFLVEKQRTVKYDFVKKKKKDII